MEKIEEFKCLLCGNCCRGPGYVKLTCEEAEKIARYMEIDLHAFYDKYVMKRSNGSLWLRDDANTNCLFLDNNNRCKIHPVKPRQCTDFPHKWRTADVLSYCQGLKQNEQEIK